MTEQLKRITLALNREPGRQDRWPIPVTQWPGFRIVEITDLRGARVGNFVREDGGVVCRSPQAVDQLLATVELEQPNNDLETAKLNFQRHQAATENIWRGRTYFFSIGSAILTAVVALTVAWMSRPPTRTGVSIPVDTVHACRDSLQRLSTFAQLQNRTIAGLSAAIDGHVTTCDSVLQGMILAAAKENSK
jgi:hypothetical protein